MRDEPARPVPLGLPPRKIHEENRICEILKAMQRFTAASIPIRSEWIDELSELIRSRQQ